MDELHAAFAAHLRRHNRRLHAGQAERVWHRTLRAYGGQQVYCKVCGRAITGGEGLFDVEKLRENRSCVDHYIPF